MKKLNRLFFILLLSMTLFSSAQDKTDEELAATYLQANGSLDQYKFAYDQLLIMLKKQYPESSSNAEGWRYLQENKGNAISEMQLLLVPIYQSNFSTTDFGKMIEFYQTDTGRQMLEDRTKMSEAQKKELNSYYNTEVGQKIVQKQASLSEAIAIASENWSRDLYETAVSLLKSE